MVLKGFPVKFEGVAKRGKRPSSYTQTHSFGFLSPPPPKNRIRCMKTERNELVYQAMDPNLAEKMKNLG